MLSLCPVPSLADFSDSRLLVVITKKRIELPHVSNAHRTHSSALYSSNPDITSAALSCTSKPAVSTVNIQLPHPSCTASCTYLQHWSAVPTNVTSPGTSVTPVVTITMLPARIGFAVHRWFTSTHRWSVCPLFNRLADRHSIGSHLRHFTISLPRCACRHSAGSAPHSLLALIALYALLVSVLIKASAIKAQTHPLVYRSLTARISSTSLGTRALLLFLLLSFVFYHCYFLIHVI